MKQNNNFDFGKNWESYVSTVNNAKIDNAVESIKKSLLVTGNWLQQITANIYGGVKWKILSNREIEQ